MHNEFKQFDVVRILRIDNVGYLSGPPGRATSPQGEWSVVGAVDGELLLAKQSTVIRIPAKDVSKIAEYDVNQLYDTLKKAGKPNIDIVAAVSKEFGVSPDKARQLCALHNIPLKVSGKQYKEKAINKLRNKIGGSDGKEETKSN